MDASRRAAPAQPPLRRRHAPIGFVRRSFPPWRFDLGLPFTTNVPLSAADGIRSGEARQIRVLVQVLDGGARRKCGRLPRSARRSSQSTIRLREPAVPPGANSSPARPRCGKPPATGPMTAMPCAAKSQAALAAIAPATAINEAGILGANRSRMSTPATTTVERPAKADSLEGRWRST